MRAATLVLVATLGFATCAGARAEADMQTVCSHLSRTAASFMRARQAGVSMARTMSIIKKNDELYRNVVIEAYEVPRFDTEEGRQRQVDDFGDAWFLKCAQAYAERGK